MFWQREFVRPADPMNLNTVYKVDLPKSGMLGSILLRISGDESNGLGNDGTQWRLIDFISKITILLNGSTVVKSLTGLEAHAIAFMDQGVTPPDTWRNNGTNTQFSYMLINLGRWLMDTDMGLDLAKYSNVELQIENNMGAAQFTNLTVGILGYYLRDAQAGQFKGYMKTEEWHAWTTIADATEYMDIPTQYPLRRVILQAIPPKDTDQLEKTGMNNLMDDIDFSLDTGQTRIWKGSIQELMRENYFMYGKPGIVGGFPLMDSGKGIDISLGYTLFEAHGPGSQTGTVSTVMPTLESGRTSYTQKIITGEAGHPIGLVAVGLAPFLAAQFDFDLGYDPSTWLDTEARKVVKLNIHTRNSASAAGGRNAIILDRLVR